ncbi:MAG: HlyC/CorC family transporter [Kiloniellales bacterium]
MTTGWLISLGAIFVLLLLSAFFSGSETALTAASRPRIHQLAEQGNRRAGMVRRLQQQRDRLIGAILLGNNLVNIMASALATGVLIGLFGDAGVLYATVVMTMLILIFAEVLPKTYAIARSVRTALAVAPVIRLVVVVFAPVTLLVRSVARGSLRLLGAPIPADFPPTITEEELRGVIDLHKGPGADVAHERAMLRSILDLDEVEVSEIMTHRKAIAMLDADEPPDRLVEQVLESPYTRIPLYREDPDNVIGVLHAKALLKELRGRGNDLASLDVTQIAVKPWFVPETTSLLDQLQAFRQRHEHFALVVDEYGALMGVVTLEDILEEIVGEISDEHDLLVHGVRPQPDGSFIVDGSVTIRDLNREYDWRLPDDEAATIAGLVLHESRQIPEVGQVFEFYGFRFEILRRQRNQITSLRIVPPGATGS